MSRKTQQAVDFDTHKKLQQGRLLCECQASYHRLINNCISCGRIVCEQEGEGPCFFCGNKIYDKQKEQTVITDSEQMFPELIQADQTEYLKAVRHKDKLLDYHRKDIHQSQIYDDQTDYFQISENIWEDEKVRKQAITKILERSDFIQEEQKSMHIQFDPTTMQIIDGQAKSFDESKFKQDAIQFQKKINLEQYQAKMQELEKKQTSINCGVDERLYENELSKQIYEDIRQELQSNEKNNSSQKTVFKPMQCKVQNQDFYESMQRQINEGFSQEENKNEVYDKEFFNLEECENFHCLSMLQPWASLLVEGFKRVEGRAWNTSYRGPLWIHAGATPSSPEQQSAVEYEYEQVYKDNKNKPPFPSRYAYGALIGLVDLVGVIEKEAYEKIVPQDRREEGSSQFKFIIRNPRKLFYPISMRGNKGIFRIDESILNQAIKLLQKVPANWAPFPIPDNILIEIEKQNEQQYEQMQKHEQKMEEEQVQDFQKESSIQIPQTYFTSNPIQQPKLAQKQDQKTEDVEAPLLYENLTQSGFIIKNILNSDQICAIANYFEQKIPQSKSKKVGQISLVTNSFPNIDILIDKIGISCKTTKTVTDKSFIQRAMKNVQVNFLKPKDMIINRDPGVFCVMVIGDPVDVKVDGGLKGIFKVKEGKIFILLDQKDSIKIQVCKESDNNSTLKICGQDYNFKSWVVIFGEHI